MKLGDLCEGLGDKLASPAKSSTTPLVRHTPMCPANGYSQLRTGIGVHTMHSGKLHTRAGQPLRPREHTLPGRTAGPTLR